MVLLDTCTLLWLAADQQRLSADAKATITQNAGELFVSSISAFEIAIKASRGKLDLPMEAGDWFSKATEFHGVDEIPVNSDIAIRSVQLPWLHNDPCDRLIVATALRNDMAIITCDSLIAQYENVRVVW